jgi:segregation and condensation protein A
MTPEPDRADAFVAGAPAAVGNAGAPALRLGAWEGPLDLLLELARAQRVDLAQLSIATLAEQFAAAVDAAIARRQVPLSRLAEWHIMAAWLTLLRTRLLLPDLPDETAQAEAAGQRQRLADRDTARRLADWLERRPQLGRDLFGRGEAEPAADTQPAADLTALLRACLTLLELPARERAWRPNPPPLWRVPDALAQMRRLLAAMPQGGPLEEFLPTVGQGPIAQLQQRAALASTLVAGLELSRDGAAVLDQDAAFGEVRVTPVASASENRGGSGNSDRPISGFPA